ncbi:hypothetical protein LC593_10815 [Nostoc sp. CHAB 5844]|nr:hypothetical protein [Nostoc sp. CHAB 5844]
MTTITGKFVDSGGVAFDGDLTLTLDAPLIDIGTTPDSIYTLAPHIFTFSSGTLSGVNVVQSATSNVTYHFVVNKYSTKTTYWLPDGTQYDGPVVLNSGNYYTGTFYDPSTSVRVGPITSTESSVVMDFHAIIPNVASVEFADLIPSRISTDSLPRTVRAIAEILTSDADFVEALRCGPRFKGSYSAATYYQRDDAVTYGGSSWVYINNDPAAGQTPSTLNTTYWQILAQKGDPGGTGGNDTAYNATGWDGQLDAPSRNAVRDIIELLAPKSSPQFADNPTCQTQLTTDNSTRLASTAFVQNAITARLDSTNLTNNPTTTTQSTDNNSTRVATTEFVKAAIGRYSRITDTKTLNTAGGASIAGTQARTLNTININSGDITNLSSNKFTLRSGTYLIRATAPAVAVLAHRLSLQDTTNNTRVITGTNAYAAASNQTHAFLAGRIIVSGNTDFELRHYTASAVATNGLGIAINESGQSEVYAMVEIERID